MLASSSSGDPLLSFRLNAANPTGGASGVCPSRSNLPSPLSFVVPRRVKRYGEGSAAGGLRRWWSLEPRGGHALWLAPQGQVRVGEEAAGAAGSESPRCAASAAAAARRAELGGRRTAAAARGRCYPAGGAGRLPRPACVGPARPEASGAQGRCLRGLLWPPAARMLPDEFPRWRRTISLFYFFPLLIFSQLNYG